MIESDETLVIGVSGGPDSMALLDGLNNLRHELGIKLVAVHVNHLLRGSFADHDASYVQAYCENKNIPCEIFEKDVHQYAKKNKISFEEAGRLVRYQCFLAVKEKYQAHKIAIGQNLNDLVETFWLNVFRGAGIRGLASIDYVREDLYIRPLLEITRKEIELYCKMENLNPRYDHTNQSLDYMRNRVRNELLPLIESAYNPNIMGTIKRTTEVMKEQVDFWAMHCEKLFSKLGTLEKNGAIKLSYKAFDLLHFAEKKQLLRYVIEKKRGHLQNISSVLLDQLLALREHGKRVVLDSSFQVIKRYDYLYVESIQEEKSDEMLKCPFTIETQLDLVDELSKADLTEGSILVDADQIKGKLYLRHRINGDRFRPLGMKGEKKLKDFLIDLKVPREEREDIWLLCDEEKIIWVVGLRMNELCKVTKNTKKVMKISLEQVVLSV